jgi:phosphohistidine phosphatase
LKKLYILRHAKAVLDHGEGDEARALAPRGRKAAAAMGEFIARQPLAPALALCSTAIRTRETLAQILTALRPAPRVSYEEALYLADTKRLLQRIQKIGDDIESALLVGHNPGVQDLAMRLVSDPAKLGTGFPTAALVVIEIPESWAALEARTARLVAFQTPTMLSPDLDDD